MQLSAKLILSSGLAVLLAVVVAQYLNHQLQIVAIDQSRVEQLLLKY